MNRPTRWLPRFLLAALAVLAVAVVACGGDDDDTATAVPDDLPAVDTSDADDADPADDSTETTVEDESGDDSDAETDREDEVKPDGVPDQTSVPSVPHDEGIDDPPVAVTDLDVIGGPETAVARFEAVIETSGELCVALQSDLDDITGVHIHIGASGETGDIFVDVTDVLTPGDHDWLQGCTSVGEDIESGLTNSTDALYVDVHTGGQSDGALRGQLAAATLFDLELR